MKKSGHIKKLAKRSNSKSISVVRFRYVSIGLGLIALIIAGNLLVSASSTVHVLGTSTSNLLARGGDESHDESESSGQHSDISNSGSSSSNSNSDSPSTTNDKQTSASTTTDSGPSQSTKVDCVGPDGKHFVTSFHDCQELNVKWNNSNFKFTVVSNASSGTSKIVSANEVKEHSEPKTKTLEIKTENTKTELNLEKNGRHVEIKKEDDGKLHIRSKDEDGTEVELEQSDALEKLNDSLKDQGIEIGTGSASKFTFRAGKVETHTDFPLSVDPSTNQLSVTTPSGTHELTILPDHAIQNLLDLKVFSNILSTADSNTASAEASNNTVGLTEIDNQPAFEIEGVANKKLLGIFPVAFTKKVFVSSDNGKILKTQQSTFDNFLEKISF